MRSAAWLSAAPVVGAALAGCSSAGVGAAAEIRVLDAGGRSVDADVQAALRDYDLARLQGLWRERLDRLEAAGWIERAELHTFGRLAHGVADHWKLRETLAADAADRKQATTRRLAVVDASLPHLLAGLEADPHDGELAFTAGELLAFRIDGVVSGLRLGPESEAWLRRSPLPEARLALAKRFYYLPAGFGGDLERCERELLALLAEHPDLEPAWGFLGQVRVAAGDRSGAVDALERACDLNPRSLRGRAFLDPLGVEAAP